MSEEKTIDLSAFPESVTVREYSRAKNKMTLLLEKDKERTKWKGALEAKLIKEVRDLREKNRTASAWHVETDLAVIHFIEKKVLGKREATDSG